MKTIIISVFILFGCIFSNVQAQSYKLNKEVYNPREYFPQPGDPNNPMLAGLGSLFIPGLGQVLCGETGRGLAFFGGSMAFMGVSIVGMVQNMDATLSSSYSSNNVETKGLGLMFAGFLGYMVVDVWSIFDAVNVAKVNNMYFQDMRGNLSSVKIELNPFVDTKNYLGQTNTSAGLSLKVTF